MIALVMENRIFTGNSDERLLRPYFDRGRGYDVYYPQQQTFYYGLFLLVYTMLVLLIFNLKSAKAFYMRIQTCML